MKWYGHLYVDQAAGKKKDRLIREIEQEKYKGNTYLITLAANPQNLLEFFPVRELKFPYYRRNCPLIVGLAAGKESAQELVEMIVRDVYEKTGGVDIRGYFDQI